MLVCDRETQFLFGLFVLSGSKANFVLAVRDHGGRPTCEIGTRQKIVTIPYAVSALPYIDSTVHSSTEGPGHGT